jgi:molybdate transport system substrate-binding protein
LIDSDAASDDKNAMTARAASESLLPVPGIDHITPLPPEVQKLSVFSAGIAVSSTDSDAARSVIQFLSSPEAFEAIKKSGLEPIGNQ